MKKDKYIDFANSIGSYGSSKSYNNSIKSRITKRSKTNKSLKKSSPKIYEVDNSKTGLDLSKYDKIKQQLFCSFCANQIMKSGLNFSCKHILCSSCISRQILKIGLNNLQNKNIEGILNIECPCKSGNVEISIENLISLLYINEECLSHGEFKSCGKCSMWASVLTQMKKCIIHNNNINSKNHSENIIINYCITCQKELCSLCEDEFHDGHSIKSINNIVEGIHQIKLKNQSYKEFSNFIQSIEQKFNQEYDNELNINISRLNEGIKLLNQIKNDFIEKMNKKIIYSRNIFTLIKYIYYFYYKDLATVQNNIRVIDFLFNNKYELQNISFHPNKDFSQKIENLFELIKNLKIETFDCELNIKNNFSNCTKSVHAHDGYIFDLLNINNKYLLSAGEDRKIKIWSLDYKSLFTRIEIDSLEHTSSVFSLCKQNNGKKFFSGSYGEIKIWSSEDFNLINILYGHKDYISHMEIIQKKINPFIDNNYKDYLCSCSYDHTFKIWDFDILNCICTLSGHSDHINYFIQTKPGFMVSCSSDKSIKFWDIEKEKYYLSLNEAHDSPIYSLVVIDEEKIVSSSFSKIKVHDLNLQKCDTIYSENNKGVYKLLMLPGNKLISSSFKYINFWDLNKNIWLYSIEGHKDYITCLLIYDDKLISSGDDGDIKMYK